MLGMLAPKWLSWQHLLLHERLLFPSETSLNSHTLVTFKRLQRLKHDGSAATAAEMQQPEQTCVSKSNYLCHYLNENPQEGTLKFHRIKETL